MQEMVRVREVSLLFFFSHADLTSESINSHHADSTPQALKQFSLARLALLREFAGPYALHTCFHQMELSMYYRSEVVQRPPGI